MHAPDVTAAVTVAWWWKGRCREGVPGSLTHPCVTTRNATDLPGLPQGCTSVHTVCQHVSEWPVTAARGRAWPLQCREGGCTTPRR